MISLPRPILHTFRTLVRRAGLHKRQGGEPCFALVAGPDGCRIQAASPEVAIEYQHAGQFDAETMILPIEALNAWKGRGKELVTLEQPAERHVLASWSDRGVARQSEHCVSAKAAVSFPERPTNFTPNEPALWGALRNAIASTDECSTRYALSCLHMRGALGRIDATDGRQILSQTGFNLGWNDDLLVPASPLLGHRDLDLNVPVIAGRAGDWVGFGIGSWLVMLKINKDGRFPRVDDILPNHEFARSRLELSATDAEFLADALPRLPCDGTQDYPITLDLNGRVLIRSREAPDSRTTEVELRSSQLTGEPVTLNTNRRFLERAVKLGFREAFVYGAESPMLCRDERRRFLWALLDPKDAVPRSDDPVRIDSPSQPTATPTIQTSRPHTMAAEKDEPRNQQPATNTDRGERRKATKPTAATAPSPIEQAISLRTALRAAASQANELIRSLKREKRQRRLVDSTLQSLKALQRVG